jgi:putative redox protein
MLTIMGIVAARHGIDLAGTAVTVEKEMTAVPVRRIAKLSVLIAVPLDPGAESRKLLETAAFTCPVHASLHPDVQRPVTFRWGR